MCSFDFFRDVSEKVQITKPLIFVKSKNIATNFRKIKNFVIQDASDAL